MHRLNSSGSPPWSSPRIVATYLSFFEEHGHLRIPGSRLTMPESTTAFTIAGMQPLMPYLSARESPPAPRLTSLQRCLRTDDVEMVGRNIRKMSSFHMLGNWSIGDYGRRQAIDLAMQVLALFGIDRHELWITTFAGDDALGLPPDEEIVEEWLRIGIPRERLVPLGADDNFWTTGEPGPCGRDSELFIDRGESESCGNPTCRPGCPCGRFLEIWNLVFIELEQLPDGSMVALPVRSVDTGMGLERVAMTLQRMPSVFEIDLFTLAMRMLDDLTPARVGGSQRENVGRQQSRRMIVDHARAALFLGAEGVMPASTGRGSVLRRLIRRAATRGRLLGITGPFLSLLLEPLATTHSGLSSYQEASRPGDIPDVASLAEMVRLEEENFSGTLRAGLQVLDRIITDEHGVVPGERLFQLHAERGFPVDLAAEVLADRGFEVEWSSFQKADAQHRQVSRARTQTRLVERPLE
jgi:alanyl-tRNA synthetase